MAIGGNDTSAIRTIPAAAMRRMFAMIIVRVYKSQMRCEHDVVFGPAGAWIFNNFLTDISVMTVAGLS
jgi:hypothetical protein